MNLAEFVEETLSEVLSGIRAAQSKEGGGAIGAAGVRAWTPTYHISSLLAEGLGDDVFTVVEFDVSVLAETSGGGKGTLKVWSVGSIEAGGKRSDQHTSRVRFAVQVKIPPGDKRHASRDLTDDWPNAASVPRGDDGAELAAAERTFLRG